MDSFDSYYATLCGLQTDLSHNNIFAHSTRDMFNKDRSDSVVNIIRNNIDFTDELTCIDMFCGHGGILQAINKSFSCSKTVGIDITRFNTWSDIKKDNCLFIQQNVFDTIKIQPDFVFDVVVTFNTLRAENRQWGIEHHKSFLAWCAKHSRYLITNNCTKKQFDGFELVDTILVPNQYDTNLFKSISHG
jgi:hypothetical protein